MVKYFKTFHDFSQNLNCVRKIFVSLIHVLNAKTNLEETLKSIFEAFLRWSKILKYFMFFVKIKIVLAFTLSLKFVS